LTCHDFDTLEEQAYTVTYWKAFRYSKYNLKDLWCGSTLNICQDVLKSDNVLHKKGHCRV